MTKYEFLEKLSRELSAMPRQDREKSLAYYSEMLDDYVEDGMSEEEAVRKLGSVKAVAAQILEDANGVHPICPKRKLSTLEIVLLIVGSPIWLSLLVAAVAVALSLLISFFAVLISVIAALWAVSVSFAVTSVAGIFLAVRMFMSGFLAQGIFFAGAALLLAGLAVLIYFGSLHTTLGCVKLVKNTFGLVKRKPTKGGQKDA